jgi:hypothetical protein
MAWQLEIHHIDVVATGDATLIIAREVAPFPPGAVGPRIRSVLIDGGRATSAAAVQAYVAARIAPATDLTALIVTHYDIDHVNGVIWLLKQAGICDNVTIYDQGWPSGGLDNTYINYVRAINGRNVNGAIPALANVNRTRATSAVRSDNVAINPLLAVVNIGVPAVPVAVNRAANWLLGGVGAPPDVFWGAGAVPANAPRMRFIAANAYVRTAGGGTGGPYLTLGADSSNEKSLAVEVTFANFRYYCGGDIETPQEDHIQALLNANDNAAGRVLAMKTSHHGANTSTSRAFVDQLRPQAAFVSCGTANMFQHPAQQTVNVLDGYQPNPNAPGALQPHAAAPPAPPFRPVSHYLTGYQVVAPIVALPPGAPPLGPQSLAGTAGLTAGDPVAILAIIPGHIRVSVTFAQANANVAGGLYLAVVEAATAAATAAGVPGVMLAAAAVAPAAAAAEAAMSAGASAAANQFLSNLGVVAAATQAGLAATGQVNAGSNGTVTAAVVALAALGAYATCAQAAAAGAAAGTVVGGIGGLSVQNAVASALLTVLNAAGIGTGGVAAAAAAAALAAAPAGQFTVTFRDRAALVNPRTITHA